MLYLAILGFLFLLSLNILTFIYAHRYLVFIYGTWKQVTEEIDNLKCNKNPVDDIIDDYLRGPEPQHPQNTKDDNNLLERAIELYNKIREESEFVEIIVLRDQLHKIVEEAYQKRIGRKTFDSLKEMYMIAVVKEVALARFEREVTDAAS
jgi:hypothetical protein